jgi:hypothetical protein
MDNRTIVLSKGLNKGKRFRVTMSGFDGIKDHHHEFGAKGAKTFVDGRTQKEKEAWEARHSVNKNWDNIHSPVFYSRHLLWGKHKDINKNIKDLAKLLKATIKVRI